MENSPTLSSQMIEMLISSVTHQGHAHLSEIEVERLLNAIARVQSGVPTGVNATKARAEEQHQAPH